MDDIALRRLGRFSTGATPSRHVLSYWENGTIPWLASGAVNQRRITAPSKMISKEGFAASSTKWIPAGSIVIALAGQGRTKGMCATVEAAMTGNQSLAFMTPNPDFYDYRFVAYAVETQYLDIRGSVGTDLRNGLNLENVKSIVIPNLGLEDQKVRVRYLDHAELRIAKAIQAKQKMVALLNEQKQVIISELVTRGLDPDVPMKDSGQTWLGQIPAHWDLHRMKSQFDEIVKKGRPDLPLLAATQSMGVVTKESYGLRTVTATRGLENLKIVEPGDFVISLRSFQGGLEISYANGIISPAYTILRAKDGTNNQFFTFMFKSKPFLSAIQMTITGIREGQNVDYRRLGLTMIPIPPRDEQIEINNAVTSRTQSIDRASEALLREIELLKEYRTVLISDVVTGKKDVRAEASDLPEVDPAELAQVLSGAVSVDGEEDEVDGASETE